MRIFCINMANSTERREYMESEFKKIGHVDYEFIDAVDGRTLAKDELEKISDRRYQKLIHRREFFPGEVGCVLSHQKAAQTIIDQRLGAGLIMEDDVSISPEIAFYLPMLEEMVIVDEPKIILLSKIKANYLDGKWALIDRMIVHVARARLGYGYVINSAAAKLYIDTNRPIRYVADDWKRVRYFSKGRITIQAIVPPLLSAGKMATNSDIRITYEEKKDLLKKKTITNIFSSNLLTVPLKLNRWIEKRSRGAEKTSP